MLIFLFQLLLVRITICDETSSFLSNVLTKIQRERLGQLDEEIDSYNDDDNLGSESNDYLYINDANDLSDDTFKDYQGADAGDPYNTQETKTKTHYKSTSSLPTNDLVYIYNDTIYLYKAPKISGHSKPGNQEETHLNGKMKFGMIPYKMKIKTPGPPGEDGTVDVTNPADLINIVLTGNEENPDMTAAPPEGDDEEVEGYYYKYYPIDQLPPELANLVMNMGSKEKPIKPGMVIKPSKKPMKPGMPMKPVMMMKKKKRPVGPLFKAMAVFVGTAVVFIATILLLPRVKLVKAKSTGLNFLQMYDDDDDDDDDDKPWAPWGSH